MTIIRPYAPTDLDALYEICVRTGDFGEDARDQFDDPKMLGYVFAAPYGKLSPDLCFVAEDDVGVAGYVVGTADSRWFEAQMEEHWWPGLRKKYTAPEGARHKEWTGDELYAWTFHHARPLPEEVVIRFPAHLHMNLLPRLQGQGMGTRLFQTWRDAALDQGVTHAHIGADRGNKRGVAFWSAMGFRDLTDELDIESGSVIWMGQAL